MVKKLFVTVGSTRFDTLVNTVLDSAFLELLSCEHYASLTLQHGQSVLAHPELLKPAFLKRLGMQVQAYAYKNDILDDMKEADVVICHAGKQRTWRCRDIGEASPTCSSLPTTSVHRSWDPA